MNFYEPCQSKLALGNEISLNIQLTGHYPFDGDIQLQLDPEAPVEFSLFLRLPGWCNEYRLRLNGIEMDANPMANGYLEIQRLWNPRDVVVLNFAMPVRVVVYRLGNNGRAAFVRGPLVYAADSSYLPEGSVLDDIILLLDKQNLSKNVKVNCDEKTQFTHLIVRRIINKPVFGRPFWKEKERYYDLSVGEVTIEIEDLELVPFFDAGNRQPGIYREGVNPHNEPVTNFTYQVWLPYDLHTIGTSKEGR